MKALYPALLSALLLSACTKETEPIFRQTDPTPVVEYIATGMGVIEVTHLDADGDYHTAQCVASSHITFEAPSGTPVHLSVINGGLTATVLVDGDTLLFDDEPLISVSGIVP